MQDRTKLFIDGEWVPSTGTGTIDVINATTEEVIGRVAEGTPEAVARNLQSATGRFLADRLSPEDHQALRTAVN